MSGSVLDQELAVTFPDNFLESRQVLVVNPDPDVGVVDLDACYEENREESISRYQLASVLKNQERFKNGNN